MIDDDDKREGVGGCILKNNISLDPYLVTLLLHVALMCCLQAQGACGSDI